MPKNPNKSGPHDEPADATREPSSWLATEKIVLRKETAEAKPVRRKFPGPLNADVALRVAIERRANAELIAHAKEMLDVEVCGVLAGQVCEDDEGIFLHVSAAIRGSEAAQASTHVTFTQAAWNNIHQTLERDFPGLRIVGWYHTHPGFGVEFSEMDLFIQKNFFAGQAQIALVTDPINGTVAICINTPEGVRYLPKFWVDGREQTARVPLSDREESSLAPSPKQKRVSGDDDLARIDSRLSQLVQAIDQQRAWQHNFMLFCGIFFCLAVILCVGYVLIKSYNSQLEPPRVRDMVPVPIQVGDKTVMVGVGIVEWKVPDELNAILLREDLLRKEAEAKAEKAAALLREKENARTSNNAHGTNSASAPEKAPAKK